MERRICIVPTYGKAGRLGAESIQRKRAPDITMSNGWLSFPDADRCLCWLVGCEDEYPAEDTLQKMVRRVRVELRAKRRGYQEQDKRRGWDPASVLSEKHIAERMLVQRQKCWHCGVMLHLLYRDRYDPVQWSVDRLDNGAGHTKDNIVISCMRCNLKRGNKSIRTYTAVKQSPTTRESLTLPESPHHPADDCSPSYTSDIPGFPNSTRQETTRRP